MKKHETTIRVRYGETDQMGVVYYGNYAQYLEIARVEWMRSQGVSYKEMEEDGIMLPVVNLTVNYKKPAVYDEELTLCTSLKEIPNVKITFQHEIYNVHKQLLNTAEVTLVFVDMKTNRPMRCPDFLLEKFKN